MCLGRQEEGDSSSPSFKWILGEVVAFLFLNRTDCAALLLSHTVTCSLVSATVDTWGCGDPAAFQLAPIKVLLLSYFSSHFPFLNAQSEQRHLLQ